MDTSRRNFCLLGTAAFAEGAAARLLGASGAPAVQGETASTSLPKGGILGSAPVLMNPAERSMDVVFAVNGEASGWVDVAKSPDMRKSVRVYSGDGPVMRVNGRIAIVRLKGLEPATRYWYRAGADRIEFKKGYIPQNHGPQADSRVYSFTTLGAGMKGSFCVINDTHDFKPTLDLVLSKIAELKPSVVIWNGDARSFYKTIDDAIGTFLKVHPNHPSYAAETPIMFLNGNHDYRGRFALHLTDIIPFRDISERDIKYASLGRNFVQRIGDIALIGLDTGEDKLDTNPLMGGILRMMEYRDLQTRWLAEEIEKPAVKTAKFKVAFCHIPLFDSRANSNPGDVFPADSDPRYSHPWAAWQRTCANLWGPLLRKAEVQLVVTGHQHVFRFDPPAKSRTWAHIVGGGPDYNPKYPFSFPTVIEGVVRNQNMSISVYNVGNGKTAFKKEF